VSRNEPTLSIVPEPMTHSSIHGGRRAARGTTRTIGVGVLSCLSGKRHTEKIRIGVWRQMRLAMPSSGPCIRVRRAFCSGEHVIYGDGAGLNAIDHNRDVIPARKATREE
jgi:hypothetical protein